MKETIKKIIVEFHEQELPENIDRRYDIKLNKEFISVLYGPRRVGKTYLLYQLIKGLIKKGTNKEDIIYLNFADERVAGLKQPDLILEAYYELFPEKAPKYLFFDEIQDVAGWELFINRIYETKKYFIAVTGSSSKLLSKEISTSLRGRALSYQVKPLTFSEFLDFKGFKVDNKTQYSKKVYQLKRLFDEYLIYGGYPSVVKSRDIVEKRAILSTYLELAIFKDIVERYSLRSSDTLFDMIRYIIQNLSKLFSTIRIFNTLKKEKAVSKDTIIEYLSHLKEIGFVFLIEKHSNKLKERMVNPKKVAIFDNGICSLYLDQKRDTEKLLENVVYLNLKGEIRYYMTRQGKEVDFFDKDKKMFIQVCLDLSAEETFKRETTALYQALDEVKNSKGIIITYDTEKDLGKIKCIPAWKWLLS